MTQAIGEIVVVNTTGFVAQCLEAPVGSVLSLIDPPSFGSFVKIAIERAAAMPEAVVEVDDDVDPFVAQGRRQDYSFAIKEIYAVVSHAQTGSLAPGRRPRALGMASESEMRAEYPQVFELLTTEFSGLLVGYSDQNGRLRRYLPPMPPRIHAPVVSCDSAEVIDLTENLAFLRFILAMGQGLGIGAAPADSLVAACIRHAFLARDSDIEFLENAGRTLLPLLGDDYQRLQGIIESAGAL